MIDDARWFMIWCLMALMDPDIWRKIAIAVTVLLALTAALALWLVRESGSGKERERDGRHGNPR